MADRPATQRRLKSLVSTSFFIYFRSEKVEHLEVRLWARRVEARTATSGPPWVSVIDKIYAPSSDANGHRAMSGAPNSFLISPFWRRLAKRLGGEVAQNEAVKRI